MYYRIEHDWDGLRGLAAVELPRQAQLVRPAIPAGSIVPTILSRRPVGLKRVTQREIAALRAGRLRTQTKLRRIMTMPERQLVLRSRTLRGFVPPGFGGFDGTDTGSAELLRTLSANLQGALDEIQGMGITEELQNNLGGTLLGQRAGDISAALGIDVPWQDLVSNASGEFARIRSDLWSSGVSPETILTTLGFEHISAIFKDQGQSVSSLRDLASTARSLYDRFGSDVMNNIVGDAGAFGEGGLRRMMERVLGEGAGQWLTGENLQRLGGVAEAWIGAGSSGSATGYVTAVGTTIATVGAGLAATSVAVPWGTAVAAVGALITLIVSLLGDEEPPPPPEIKPCEGASPKAWQRNPEAWTALAMWLVAKDGRFFDSDPYKEAERRKITVQQVIAEQGWFATIDRYTGEAMVQEPGPPGRRPAIRRLLDVIDRDAFVLNWDRISGPGSTPEVFYAFERMRPAFGMQPDARDSKANFLWCMPNPMETLTRFFGAEQFRIRDSGEGTTSPFRSDPDQSNAGDWDDRIGGGFSWNWIGEDWFWSDYMRTMVVSIYLAGTVPYGARTAFTRMRSGRTAAMSTGVGGSSAFHPIEIMDSQRDAGLWQPIPQVPGAMVRKEDGEIIPYEELSARLADQEWQLAHRIPVPSPDIQSEPTDQVKRPRAGCKTRADGRIVCLQARVLAPRDFIRRAEVLKTDAGGGMSTGKKLALGATAVAVLTGGGYYFYKRSKGR